jgi:ribosomal protein S18 acetylase RimI-like enzyme
MLEIRPATVHDLPGAYRVCLETADSGGDASGSYRNPDLLGHVFVGPYIVGAPDLARVVADEHGVAGYLFGAADTLAFASWAEAAWWPPLRRQYPELAQASPDAEAIRLIHRPPVAPDDVIADYPSHLHIDLLGRARGRGLGRAMVDGLTADLRARGSRGVHLEVGAGNENAIAFYRHLGFEVRRTLEESLLMGLRLD